MSEEDSDYGDCSDDEMDDDDDDDVYGDYYKHEEVEMENKKDDPEYFEFQLLKVEDVDRLLNENVEALSRAINVSN